MMQDGRQWLFGFSIENDTPGGLTGQAEADSHLILLSRAAHRGGLTRQAEASRHYCTLPSHLPHSTTSGMQKQASNTKFLSFHRVRRHLRDIHKCIKTKKR